MENSDVKLYVNQIKKTASLFIDGYFVMCLGIKEVDRFVKGFDDYDVLEWSLFEYCYFLYFNKVSAL